MTNPHKTVHFHFHAPCMIFTPGHHHEESTILGETPLKEQAPAASYQTIFTKRKASPPLHLQPSPGSTCRISTSLLVLLKKSRGRPPSWDDSKNCHPTSDFSFRNKCFGTFLGLQGPLLFDVAMIAWSANMYL